MKIIIKAALSLLVLGWASIASALTYTSISQPYTSVTVGDVYTFGPEAQTLAPVLGDHFEGSLTFGDQVTNDFTGQINGTQLIDWTLTSGQLTSNINNSHITFAFITFENGQLSSFIVMIDQNESMPYRQQFIFNPAAVMVSYLPNATIIADSYNKAGPAGQWQLVSAVPEPETYAMLLAGLGFMGLIRLRSKR
ncbi:MAG: PEP-CTERM sorting domain-containing protein [Methylophilaceae bacterium]